MAPLRRYLRITKYSVLEVRIYLDNPHLAESWLLNPRRPILPTVIQSVRPLVLPKLKEENEPGKKGSKRRAVKDTIVHDDFEVSVFLTDLSMRHSILSKNTELQKFDEPSMHSGSNDLTGSTLANAVRIDDGNNATIRGEGDSDSELSNPVALLQETPQDDSDGDGLSVYDEQASTRQKRRRSSLAPQATSDIVQSDDGPSKRKKHAHEVDEKKNLSMRTTYDGFSIYGKVLCLIVKKRGASGRDSHGTMRNWIASTQLPQADYGG